MVSTDKRGLRTSKPPLVLLGNFRGLLRSIGQRFTIEMVTTMVQLTRVNCHTIGTYGVRGERAQSSIRVLKIRWL